MELQILSERIANKADMDVIDQRWKSKADWVAVDQALAQTVNLTQVQEDMD